jgi:uncharacterized protein YyaL (SSP411 family)
MKTADTQWGGFGRAPKFPQTFTIHFLLAYGHQMKNEQAVDQALLSLDKMLQGGIYDQIGGGFARYSTDTEWLAPHFEKMLYDNALLVSVLSEAYQLTQNKVYKDTIDQTLAFVERELMHPEGGFFSALDADSEGEEGKFYVWNHGEVEKVLEEDAEIFCRYFDITPKGNWEGKSILWIKKPLEAFAAEQNLDAVQLGDLIRNGRDKLLQLRASRARPQLDDKVILAWNALMNMAYSKAYAATTNDHYRQVAESNMEFLLQAFKGEGELLSHTWKNGTAKHPAFLDDYSNLIAALIDLGQVTGNFRYFDEALKLTEVVVKHFSDEQSVFFFYTHRTQGDVLIRKKEIYDGATPSGNSVMAHNLYRLSIVFNHREWRERAERMLYSIGEVIIKYPTSFGVWLDLFFEIISGTNEVAIIGKDWKTYLVEILAMYLPNKMVMGAAKPSSQYPLLESKAETGETRIYLCQNYSCRQPVTTVQDFTSLLKTNNLSGRTITK